MSLNYDDLICCVLRLTTTLLEMVHLSTMRRARPRASLSGDAPKAVAAVSAVELPGGEERELHLARKAPV